MRFSAYLRSALTSALLTGLGLGVLFLGLVLAGLRIGGSITLDLDIGVAEGLWSLLVLPAFLLILTLLAAPLVYLALAALRWFRRRSGDS